MPSLSGKFMTDMSEVESWLWSVLPYSTIFTKI